MMSAGSGFIVSFLTLDDPAWFLSNSPNLLRNRFSSACFDGQAAALEQPLNCLSPAWIL